MPLTPEQRRLQRWQSITETPSRLPVKPLTLPAYPAEVIKAFPKMQEHWKKSNDMLASWIKAENVRQG